MVFLKKDEIVVICVTLLVLLVISSFNISISLRRRRDAQRLSDTRAITNALIAYQEDFGFYPPASSDGKIIACARAGQDLSFIGKQNAIPRSGYELLLDNAQSCQWGADSFRDIADPNFPAYIERLPIDPKSNEGRSYFYISTGNNFQILASLESEDEDEYKQELTGRGVMCGEFICNHSRSSLNLPLEKSLEEYENELLRQKLLES